MGESTARDRAIEPLWDTLVYEGLGEVVSLHLAEALVDALIAHPEVLRALAGVQPPATRPSGDTVQAPDGLDGPPIPAAEVEAWIKAARDHSVEHDEQWHTLDGLLDDYRLHRVTGTPLTAHACEGSYCCADGDARALLGTNTTHRPEEGTAGR